MPHTRRKGLSWRGLLSASAPVLVLGVLLMAGVWIVLNSSRDDVLRTQAELTVGQWLRFAAVIVPEIEQAFDQGRVTEVQRAAIAELVRQGEIFELKMFTTEGELFFVSDGPVPSEDRFGDAEDVARVLAADRADVALERAEASSALPENYAEVYAPFRLAPGAAAIGVVEVYVDQTPLFGVMAEGLQRITMVLPLLVLAAFIAPALGFVVMRDQKRRRDGELQEARLDPLTGVLSRRALEDNARHLLRPGGQSDAEPVGVLFIDLDHFKQLNDELGHAAGDAELQRVAGLIQRTMRRSDVVGRIGGDEFVVLMPGTYAGAIQERTQTLRHRMTEDRPEAPHHPITLSIGAALSRPGESFDSVLARADAALYEAKRAGRDRTHLHQDDRPPVHADAVSPEVPGGAERPVTSQMGTPALPADTLEDEPVRRRA